MMLSRSNRTILVAFRVPQSANKFFLEGTDSQITIFVTIRLSMRLLTIFKSSTMLAMETVIPNEVDSLLPD